MVRFGSWQGHQGSTKIHFDLLSYFPFFCNCCWQLMCACGQIELGPLLTASDGGVWITTRHCWQGGHTCHLNNVDFHLLQCHNPDYDMPFLWHFSPYKLQKPFYRNQPLICSCYFSIYSFEASLTRLSNSNCCLILNCPCFLLKEYGHSLSCIPGDGKQGWRCQVRKTITRKPGISSQMPMKLAALVSNESSGCHFSVSLVTKSAG